MTTENTEEKIIRCGIYTRKSTNEKLEEDFTTLDAQRESAESYIASQKSQGWTVLPEKYDDGGFTGANIDRPALKRLLQDIADDKIDCIIVYKVDRLSRSLLDFTRLLELFEQNNVTFVSVTQHFNTNSSMGRLTLNILLSFAQFEREMISERITDKISASRRKGKYTGGCPPLGYDVNKEKHLLIINPEEAKLVRHIFDLYIKEQSLLKVSQIVNAQGYHTKKHNSKNGKRRGGVLFKNVSIQWIIKNIHYIGKVEYKGTIYDGEHEAILSDDIFNKAQTILKKNHRPPGSSNRQKHSGLLSKLLYCRPCKRTMVYTYAKKKTRHYKYYICQTATKHGYSHCPTKMIAAHLIENPIIASLSIKNWDSLLFEEQRQKITEIIRKVDVEREWGRLIVHFNDGTKKELTMQPDNKFDPKQEFARLPILKQFLLLAHHIRQIIDSGSAKDFKEISGWIGMSLSRIYQIMDFLKLCPQIQEDIILGPEENFNEIPEYKLRKLIQSSDPEDQITQWRKMVIFH